MGERKERCGLYKLTVVAASEQDEYLVSHYSRMIPRKVQGVAGIIEAMGQYSSAVIAPDPCYVQLPEDVQEIIESVRQVLIKRDDKMINILNRSTQEMHKVIVGYPYL